MDSAVPRAAESGRNNYEELTSRATDETCIFGEGGPFGSARLLPSRESVGTKGFQTDRLV
ncbi:MAG: hypothetical protein RLZZ232_1431 [Planctomycetota bacterium]